MARPDRSNALQTVLTILAVGAGGFLLLLVILAAAGSHLFSIPRGGVDPAMAGLAVGQPAPAITAEAWVNGEPPSLDGRVVVVQGWFYDCPYCWKEAPELVALHKKYGDRVSFVALSPDPASDVSKVEEFVAKNELKYPVGYGAVDSLMGFEAKAFPAIWVVGGDGKVLWNRSLEGEQTLDEAIAGALAGPAA